MPSTCSPASSRFLAIGYVTGRRLAFHKLSTDGSGKCDIPLSTDPAAIVYGVLYEVPEEQLSALDIAEGVGSGYLRDTIEVSRDDGSLMQAIVYLAELTAIRPDLAPYTWYHDYVVAGAREHSLPASYIAQLLAVAGIPDLDLARAKRAQRVLNASSEKPGNA